jgi:hypothetical protein
MNALDSSWVSRLFFISCYGRRFYLKSLPIIAQVRVCYCQVPSDAETRLALREAS